MRSSSYQIGELGDKARRDAYTDNLLKLLAGHRKVMTRLVHLFATNISVALLMCGFHCLSEERLPLPLLAIALAIFYLKKSGGRVLVAGWSVFYVFATASFLLLFFILPAKRTKNDDEGIAPPTTEDFVKGVIMSFGWYIIVGMVEFYSHKVFNDGDRPLLTKGKTGLRKVVAVISDVILPAPLMFWHLMFIECLGREFAGGLDISDMVQIAERDFV